MATATVGANPGSIVTHPTGVVPFSFSDYPAWVSCVEFGATGDGSTDDAVAFQNAINALAGSGVGLLCPAATWFINSKALTNTQGVAILPMAGATFTGAHASSVNYGCAMTPYVARAVVTSLAAYAGTGTGTLTASSAAAFGAQDGVAVAAGDVVFIEGGTTNLTDPKDSGPWVITTIGTAQVKWVLQRPGWWTHGALVPLSQIVSIGGEGTLKPGVSWKSFAAPGKVIGTDDPDMYADKVIQQVTLVAGTKTVSNVGIRDATKVIIDCSLATANTATSTVGYGVIAAPTAGYTGTASVVVDAYAANMTKNATDVSTVNVSISNW